MESYIPHCDALVLGAIIASNSISYMMVDNGSSVNILFRNAFNQMYINHP